MHSRREFLKSSGALVAGSLGVLSASAGAAATRKLDELVDYDSIGLAELVRSGQISQEELAEVVIRRIEALNPILNFMTTPTFDRARKAAGTFDPQSPFAGVPILIKDMIDVGGVRRTDGSRLLATNVPAENVQYIDAVEKAGLNIIGMTNVPELAGGFTTNNNLFGETLNPWNLAYSPYVSSGGAAAAAAAGVLPLVHGTDGAGSNRLPASTCGLFGFKPSRYRMLSGEAGGGHDRTKTNQAMSRTVRDSAALMDASEDKTGRRFPPIGPIVGPSARRLTVGFVNHAGGVVAVEDEVLRAQTAVAQLLEELGHRVVEAKWPGDTVQFTRMWRRYFAKRMVPLKNQIEALTGLPVTKSDLLTGFQASFASASAAITAEESAQAEEFIESLPARFAAFFEQFDVMLCPVMPRVGARNTDFDPNEAYSSERIEALLENLKFTGPVNFANCPAMAVPLTWDRIDGLPIGSHFIGPVGSDRMLYELAFELEGAFPWKDHWAPISAKYIPI